MYYIFVLITTVLAPLISTLITGAATGWDAGALHIAGLWWVFWGLGIRLLISGISQVARPGFTARSILEVDAPGIEQVVQELGFANIAMGLAGVISLFVPSWAPAIGLAGGGFLLLAGIRHMPKPAKSGKEWTALVTDLIVGLICVAFAIASLAGAA